MGLLTHNPLLEMPSVICWTVSSLGFAECIQILKENMKLDPYFTEFYNWAKENNVPIVVLSSGMVPIISGLFEELLGHKPDPKHLAIVANDVESRDGKDINTPGGWQIKYHDDRYVSCIKGIWVFTDKTVATSVITNPSRLSHMLPCRPISVLHSCMLVTACLTCLLLLRLTFSLRRRDTV